MKHSRLFSSMIAFCACIFGATPLSAGKNAQIWDGTNCQTSWTTASRLIRRTNLQGTESVLDIGCARGQITAALALQVPKGKAIGIDICESALEYANTSLAPNSMNNLFFYKLDAQNLPFINEFDVVYSFATFHLIGNQQGLLMGIRRSLKPGGRLVFNQPLGISEPLQKALESLTKSDRWSSYFRVYYPDWYFTNVHQSFYQLDKAGFEVQRIEVLVQVDRIADKELFKKFLSQWLSYLDALPCWEWEPFLEALVSTYLELQPLDNAGHVLYPQQFLEVEARVRN